MDDTNKNPGPGQYEAPRSMDLLTKSKSVGEHKFNNKASRFPQETFNTPGVGRYSVDYGNPLLTKMSTFPKAEAKPVGEVPPGRIFFSM